MLEIPTLFNGLLWLFVWPLEIMIRRAPDRHSSNDDLYAQAYQEIISSTVDNGAWVKAFAHSSGDTEKTKALYIKYRVEQLNQKTA